MFMCIIPYYYNPYTYSKYTHMKRWNNIHPYGIWMMVRWWFLLYYLWTFSTDKCASAVAEKIYINFHCVLKYMILHQIVLCCFVLCMYCIYVARYVFIYNDTVYPYVCHVWINWFGFCSFCKTRSLFARNCRLTI